MVKAIQTKILLSILAILAAIAGAVIRHTAGEHAAAKHDAEVKGFVRQQRQKKSAYPTNSFDSLNHYVP